jgi:DNA-binding MarR family transcriptional regulator
MNQCLVERKMEEAKIQKFTNNIILLFPIYNKNLIRSQDQCSLITPFNPKFRILGMLMFYGTMPMSTISKKLCVTKPGITALINKLVDEKMVARHNEKGDRRIIRISITEKGKQFLLKSRDETKETIKKNLSTLSVSDFNKLYKASEDMIKILSKINGDEDISKALNKLKA